MPSIVVVASGWLLRFRSRQFLPTTVAVALLFMLLPTWVNAGNQEVLAHQNDANKRVSNMPVSYCGVYSLYRAACALDSPLEFRELLKSDYISSREGSSLEDLIRAATDHDLYAESMRRMTCAMLRQVNCPVILHVKKDAMSTTYNHWVLYMGIEDGKAMICDGVQPMKLVEFSDLAPLWDGGGLLISDSPISLNFLWFTFIAQFLFYLGTGICIFSIVLWLHRYLFNNSRWISWRIGWRRYINELFTLFSLVVFLGTTFHLLHADSLHSSANISAIKDKHLASFLTHVKAAEVPKLMQAADVVVVDARLPTDFALGHLTNARNIPPNATSERCQEILIDVPKFTESSTRKDTLLYCTCV